MTIQQARQIAQDAVNSMPVIDIPGGLAIVDDETIEKPYAWIFFYNAQQYLATGNMAYAVGGNAPLFISKTDGQIATFRTGLSVEEMIAAYEEERQIWELVASNTVYTHTKTLLALKEVLGLPTATIADYKRSNRLQLATGSETRLLQLQQALSNKGIGTQLRMREGIV